MPITKRLTLAATLQFSVFLFSETFIKNRMRCDFFLAPFNY